MGGHIVHDHCTVNIELIPPPPFKVVVKYFQKKKQTMMEMPSNKFFLCFFGELTYRIKFGAPHANLFVFLCFFIVFWEMLYDFLIFF